MLSPEHIYMHAPRLQIENNCKRSTQMHWNLNYQIGVKKQQMLWKPKVWRAELTMEEIGVF